MPQFYPYIVVPYLFITQSTAEAGGRVWTVSAVNVEVPPLEFYASGQRIAVSN
jgi:hypothetical protein